MKFRRNLIPILAAVVAIAGAGPIAPVTKPSTQPSTQPTTQPTIVEIGPLLTGAKANQTFALPGETSLTGRFSRIPDGLTIDGLGTGVMHLVPAPGSANVLEPTGKKFTVRNFKMIDADEATFIYDGGTNTTVSNCHFGDGFINILKTNHLQPGAGGWRFSNCTVVGTSSVGFYVTTSGTLEDSYVGPSAGESCFRCEIQADKNGQTITRPDGTVQRPILVWIRNCTITNVGNKYRKAAIQARMVDGFSMSGSRVPTGIRFGQVAKPPMAPITDPTACNANCSLTHNLFSSPFPGVPPVCLYDGSTVYLAGNEFDASVQAANLPSVAVSAGSVAYLDCNVQDVPLGQKPKLLVGQSSTGKVVTFPTNTVKFFSNPATLPAH